MLTVPSSGEIYLDHHATTPVDARVAQAVLHHMVEDFGNANSVDHVYGERASEAVAAAAESVAGLLGAEPGEVLFTAGSTQALELAFSHALGTRGDRPLRIALSRVEHPAVINLAERARRQGLATLIWLEVDSEAALDDSQVEAALQEVDLLCLMAANNEVGTVYPVDRIFTLAADAGVAMLVDATQGVGRVPIDLSETPFDYLVMSGHKLYAPKGVGALVSPVYRPEENFGLAGSHAPTPNVPAIVGLGMACDILVEQGMGDEKRIGGLRDLMLSELRSTVPGLVMNGGSKRLAGNLHISAPGTANDLVVSRLRGQVAVSTGAACMSGAQGASHVLQAMGLSRDIQESALRIGLGRTTSQEDVVQAAQRIAVAIATVRTILGRQYA